MARWLAFAEVSLIIIEILAKRTSCWQ